MSWSGPSHNEKPPVPTGEHHQQTFPPPPTDQKTELPAGQQGQQPYFPPPPPGPPPANQPQYTHAPQTQQQPQYGAPPQQQQQQYAPPPAQHQADYNPAQYGGAGHHYTPPGADHTDPAASQAAAAFAATAPESTKPQKQHKGWGERLTQIGMKAAGPINAMANKMGSQSFLPTTMDKECEKAAKILQSFCKEGIASDVPPQQQPASEKLEPGKTDASGSGSSRPVTPNKAKKEQKAIVKIPSKVINKAVGLAIFTTFRAGFQFSGATGSGVLIARLPDGSWGPPSGIQVHAVGAGFMIGADIHDTVLIINSREALNAFLGNRVSLGSDVAVVAGPYGAGGVMDVGASFGGKSQKEGEQKAADEAAAAAAAKPADDGKLKPEDDKKAKRRSSSTSLKPNFSYVKSRGFYAGVQVDGTVVTERKDANAAFYGQKVSVDQIIKGQVPPQGPAGQWPGGAHLLYEALRTAEAQQPLPEANLPPPAPIPATGPVPATSPGQAPPGYGQQSPPGYGQPPQGYGQYPQGGPLGSHPPQSGPTASGALGDEQLPGYVEDNVPRPGVGDHKQQYQ